MKDSTFERDGVEARVIHAAVQGDVAAFNTLVLTHQSLAYNVAYRILGNQDAAEDATQDSFLKAYRKLGQFHTGSFRAWLLRIVTNTCYDLLRSERRHPSAALDGDDGEDARDEYDDRLRARDELPEDFAIRQELNGRIQAAINQLPADQRLVVVLRDVEGLAYEEIASSAGVPVGTVKSRLSRGRAMLRDLLEMDGALTDRWPQQRSDGRLPVRPLPNGQTVKGGAS